MAKVTSKLQVTIPKSVAHAFGIRQGDDVKFEPAGPIIRLVPPGRALAARSVAERLADFDRATLRLQALRRHGSRKPRHRGWTREELYDRGGAR